MNSAGTTASSSLSRKCTREATAPARAATSSGRTASVFRAAVLAACRNGLRCSALRPISTATASSTVNPAGPRVADASMT